MRFVETQFFLKQLEKLSSKYVKIYDDYDELKELFCPSFSTNLGDEIYKERFKNSSIPIGKRGGFRFILKVSGNIVFPLLVYSKSIKSNVSADEIEFALESVISELELNSNN